jgi:N-methylhydantoinase A
MPLYPGLAEGAIDHLGKQLNLSPYQTALGIIEIANAHMERALRVISVERGYDPRDFTLLSFGGAGGLHAVALARRLGIPRVLIPPFASTLSAFGMLVADVVKDYTLTVMLPGAIHPDEITSRLKPLSDRGRRQIQKEGFSIRDIQIEEFLDMRYQGQSYELTIPIVNDSLSGADYSERFHQEHQRTYGYQRPDADLEIVNFRVRATGIVSPPRIPTQPLENADPSAAQFDSRSVIFPIR